MSVTKTGKYDIQNQYTDFAAETKRKLKAAYAADIHAQIKGQLLTLTRILEDQCPRRAAYEVPAKLTLQAKKHSWVHSDEQKASRLRVL